MKKIIASLFLFGSIAFASYAKPKITQEHIDRAAKVVSQMTLDEKIAYIGGYEKWWVTPIDRLGLPKIKLADGPQGVRVRQKSTLYPSGIAAAATWDRALLRRQGVQLGLDAKARGVSILLGPGVNIYRYPLCGRNFEYYGEDPYLAGEIAANYILGVQSQGVMATIKHFAVNNQEFARHSVSSDVDERTLHEIYFPAFEKAVKKAEVASIMTSYNLVNSVHASESKYLNYDVIRDMWGHKGFVMSDWTSCYSPLNVATWGVDLEMPLPKCMKPELLKQLVQSGRLDEACLDRKCQHIIQTIFAYEFDEKPVLDESIPLDNPQSDAVALEMSRSAMVLLKNESLLPVKKGEFFICGPNADKVVTGGGSGFVNPIHACSVVEGFQNIGENVKTVVCTGDITALAENAKALKRADCAVVCLGFSKDTEKEDKDRTFGLPEGQVEFLREVLKYNKNVVVVLNAGGGVDMAEWLPEVKAVLMAWYPGQQGGLAIAEVITGKVNPSGKLPISIETKLEDNPCFASYYENVERIRRKRENPYSRVEYREGIFVGYRGYEKNGVQPLFPFGFGLSYTTFEYSDIKVAEDNGEFVVSFNVKNTGKVAGAEVAQIYVTDDECSVVRPVKELKGFDKVYLNPGESKEVSVRLDEEAFRFFDLGLHKFVVEPGSFTISVGASSADIRLTAKLEVK